MNRPSLSTAPLKQRPRRAPRLVQRDRLRSPALGAILAIAAAMLSASAGKPACAQSRPAAWVAEEQAADHRDGRAVAERTLVDNRSPSPHNATDNRINADYAPPPASPGMRPQRIGSPGDLRWSDAPGGSVVPIAYAAEAPDPGAAPSSTASEAARVLPPPDPAPQSAHSAESLPLSPPRPSPQTEPPVEFSASQRQPEVSPAPPAQGNTGAGPQPTLLPAPVVKPPSEPVSLTPHRQSETEGRGSSFKALGTIAGSLAIVLTLLFVALWLLRRTGPAAAQPLPVEVVELLGRAPLSGRQQMHLLRCGRKLLLVSVTPECAKTLTEITDPVEVDRLSGLCQQSRPNSATAAFRRVFEQFASARPEA